MIVTVGDLVSQVRGLVDEDNEITISDTDVLTALNRGQDYAADILAKHYEDPLLAKQAVTITSGTDLYDIPEDAFQDRLEKVEVNVANYFYDVQRVSHRDIGVYEGPQKSSVPFYYTVIGRQYQVVPTPTGTYDLRIWYLKEPEELVQEQGIVTTIDSANNFLYVDAAGDDLSTESDQLASYVNIIDAQTGKVKGTLQIQSIVDNKITFKATPLRTTVLNRTVTGDLDEVSVAADDFVCLVQGSCVPFMKKPLTHFLIQYALNELRRKLGEPASEEYQILKDFERQVEGAWVGREQQLRVKRRSNNWPFPWRRWYQSDPN